MGEKAHRKRAQKTLKMKEGKLKLVLGLDMGLDFVETMSKVGLMGKFMHKSVKPAEFEKWSLRVGMKNFLGYMPIVHFLCKSWVGI